MKKSAIIFWIFLLSISSSLFAMDANRPKKKKEVQDTTTYTTVTAKVVDKETKAPIVFASIFQTGKNVGTVTNGDGDFVLKVPGKKSTGSVSIAHIGYKNKEVSIKELKDGKKTILLESYKINIEELVIQNLDPLELLKKALSKKNHNYSPFPEMQTGFYRETIKQGRNYVSVSEAVLDIYNSGYKQNFDFDRVKIFKGRKSKDVKRMDTVLIKFQGGPRTAMFLDLVKNPGVIFDDELFTYYTFSHGGVVKVNDRNNYVINFDQSEKADFPLYQGKIYIDVESYAITSVDFKLSDKSLQDAHRVLIRKKPAGMKMNVNYGNYRVNYREIEGKWVLNYVRAELQFKMKWDKRLFKSTVQTMFEMAITDRDTENIDRFPFKVSVKYNDILADEVSNFENGDYWGEYNYIKPDESIEIAIKKLNKRLKRDK